MIKPNELRPGNFTCHKGAIIIIDGIDKSNESVMVEDRHIAIPLSEIDPITLTTDWFIKFEFEVEHDEYTYDSWYGYNGHIQIDDTEEGYKFVHGDDFRKDFVTIKYVHQLQNLFFALTGEELTIKETV